MNPLKIRIGGVEYRILYSLEMKGKLLGECDHDRSQIEISQDQSPEMIKSTLLHEAIHTLAHHIDWKPREDTVRKIEKMMFTFLRENKEVVKWLMEE
jgi:hypothetical protein